MPELAEVEAYRRLVETVVGRRIVQVHAPDPWYIKGGASPTDVVAAVTATVITGTRRIGKLALVDLGAGRSSPSTGLPGLVLGLRFGMSGRLLIDGVAGVSGMLYASERENLAWDRFGLTLAPRRRGGRPAELVVRDPRRLGGVELNPDEARLGPDALSVGLAQLRSALAGSSSAVKARLMDQSRLAGVGNLAADEILWRAGIDPARPAMDLDAAELRRLHRHLRATMDRLLAQGGSHTGELMAHRVPGGHCPRDGASLVRRTIGGRTTWSCPSHQR